ncbi:bacteriophage abortive infection AbiH family protein [Vibrio fluvialis]|uniref:bacteriophage abortive infection AbiH family protein n=1 Tax=Vibrio fluvialis TaxID=676 RepID=UPI001F254B04|nr:bacteriophage abortive infection AbiH family protein [Vibrio fluvialis]MCE7615487.1 bacteriophage abortive infection AbiH family protein [Vibrio fluvialis]
MKPNKLYVTGNGFDLHHGIASSYNNFKEYVKSHDNELYESIDTYLPIDKWWSDLEESFAYIDVDNIAESALDFLRSYNSEDWSDSYHHDYQFEVSRVINLLSVKLVERFSEWIFKLEIPTQEELSIVPLLLDKNATYFSFNYTETLINTYGINDDQILYIHGKVEDECSDIVLGHAWEPKEIPSLNSYVEPENIDARIMEGNDILDSYFGNTFKPISSLIQANTEYFSSLSEVSEVYVLGHSLSEVDIEYFVNIAKSINRSATWVVSYYGANELEHHKSVISKLGIPSNRAVYFELSSGIPKLNKSSKKDA